MAKLVEDRDVLYAPGQPVKEPRAVSWFDPDVERMLVVVDLRTLALDTAASRAATRPSSRFTRPSAISIPTQRHRSASSSNTATPM